MEITKNINHESDNPVEALGLDMERIEYILKEIGKKTITSKSKLIEVLIGLTNCPEELALISHFLGKQGADCSNSCPLTKILKGE